MSDVRHTIVDLENGTDAETVGVRVTIAEGGLIALVKLLEHGVTTPPDDTAYGTLLFQKGA